MPPTKTPSNALPAAWLVRLQELIGQYQAKNLEVHLKTSEQVIYSVQKSLLEELLTHGETYWLPTDRFVRVDWRLGYATLFLVGSPDLEALEESANTLDVDSPWVFEYLPLVIVDLETGDKYEPKTHVTFELSDPTLIVDGFSDGDRTWG